MLKSMLLRINLFRNYLWLLCLLPNLLFAREVPDLTGQVIDLANMIDSETEAKLAAFLKQHEEETTDQIVVLTVPDLNGEILEEYSLKVAETWQLGQKGKDNGVLFLISKNDRLLRIEVGYGLEGVLTDAHSSRIIRNVVVPRFKEGEFSQGIKNGVLAILDRLQSPAAIEDRKAAAAALNTETKPETSESWGDIIGSVIGTVIGGGIFLLILTFFMRIMFFNEGFTGWLFLAVFGFVPALIVATLAVSSGSYLYWFIFAGVFLVQILLRIFFMYTKSGKSFAEKYEMDLSSSSTSGSYSSGSGYSYSSSSYSSSSSSFSGGGGSFGGGGASGSW